MYKIARNSKTIRTYSNSRSSKVIDLGVNRKPMYDFLLVVNSRPLTLDVSATVFEILTFKPENGLVFPTPHLFDAPQHVNAPRHQRNLYIAEKCI